MVFDWKIQWTRTSDKSTPILITDCISANVTKSTEIKNNICQLNLKNSAVKLADDDSTIIGEYVESGTQTIKFGEEDEIRIWADFLTDASEVGTEWYDDDRLIGAFAVEEFGLQTMENQTRITLKAVDVAYLMFNAIYTFSYGISNQFTSSGVVRNCARKFGEKGEKTVTDYSGTAPDAGVKYAIDARFVSEGGYIEDYRRVRTGTDTYTIDVSSTLNGSINSTDTTITLSSTTNFEDASDATIVIGTEHISYTAVSGSDLTGCTRGIDDTAAAAHSSGATVYQGFPLILMSKIWKPLFEWIGEISQNTSTNYASETQEGGTLYFNRAFLFWIDKNNSPHWVYPSDTVDLTITLGEEGRRAFKLEKAVFDAVNFVIYNCGEDMYGNGILFYHYDDTSDVASMKMRYQPMSKIVQDLVNEDIANTNSTRETTPVNDRLKQFPTDASYPVVPDFLDDANRFLEFIGSSTYTDADNDTEYNDILRAACKWRGREEAIKITTKRTGLRYRGNIVLKGTHINPGDLVELTNGFNGLKNQKLRVINVTHQINQNKFESVINVQEDETTE